MKRLRVAMYARSIKRRRVDKQSAKKRLLADAMEAYVRWRNECLSVGDAYVRWTSAPGADAALAFAAYVAALDREEQAEKLYANLVGGSPHDWDRSVAERQISSK